MTSRGDFDLFIFDEGGVMIRNFYVIPAMARAVGMSEKELIELLKPDLGDYSRGRLDAAGFWSRVTARSGFNPPEDYFATLFSPEPEPGSFELVKDLAKRYRVVGGTNTIDSHHAINERKGFYSGFHAVYASHLMGEAKPDPAFWIRILEAEQIRPERAFFVDDTIANIEAAKKLGLHAWHFDGAIKLREHLVSIGALESL